MKRTIIFILFFVATLFAETHIFWHRAIEKSYSLIDSPGPNLNVPIQNIHEGLLHTETVYVDRLDGPAGGIYFQFGDTYYGEKLSNLILSEDINSTKGTITQAALRGEYLDGFNTTFQDNYCRSGTIQFQRAVIKMMYADIISTFGSIEDYFNILDNCMPRGYNRTAVYIDSTTFNCVDTQTLVLPSGKGGSLNPPVLDSQFASIDVTPQVQWILDHNDTMHANIYVIRLGLISGGGAEVLANYLGCDTLFSHQYLGYTPWTQDGNSMHLLVEGNLSGSMHQENGVDIKEKASFLNNYPNPFNSQTIIVYSGICGSAVILQIHSVEGKRVYKGDVEGSGSFHWDASGMPSGVYICTVSSQTMRQTRKMFLVR